MKGKGFEHLSHDEQLQEAYQKGWKDGLLEGPPYSEGYRDGQKGKQNEVYEIGHGEGYEKGYSEGYEEGRQKGKREGHEEGYGKGHEEGYGKGHTEGKRWHEEKMQDEAVWRGYGGRKKGP